MPTTVPLGSVVAGNWENGWQAEQVNAHNRTAETEIPGMFTFAFSGLLPFVNVVMMAGADDASDAAAAVITWWLWWWPAQLDTGIDFGVMLARTGSARKLDSSTSESWYKYRKVQCACGQYSVRCFAEKRFADEQSNAVEVVACVCVCECMCACVLCMCGVQNLIKIVFPSSIWTDPKSPWWILYTHEYAWAWRIWLDGLGLRAHWPYALIKHSRTRKSRHPITHPWAARGDRTWPDTASTIRLRMQIWQQ